MRQANRREIAGMLGFGIDANCPASRSTLRLGKREYLFKGRNFELPVKGHIVLAQLRQAFLGAQCLQLGQSEIFGEPAHLFVAVDRLAGFARGKFGFVGNVGGFGNLVLVPRNQNIVFGQHQVRLYEIRTLFNRKGIAGEGMFRPLTAGAAMGDNDDLTVERFFHGLAFRGRICAKQSGEQEQGFFHKAAIARGCVCVMTIRLSINLNALPESDPVGDFARGILWFGVIPRGVCVGFAVDDQRMIMRLALPSAHRRRVAALQKVDIDRIAREIVIAVDHHGII